MLTQSQAILQHLQTGQTLTPLEAFALYGTLSMHSRAAELRSQGHNIECEMVRVDSGKRVGRYRLVPAAPQQ